MPGPRVLVVVTGSIAAYKSCELIRRLQDRGVEVRVAMTANAAQFVRPLTFAALSGHRVLQSSFDDPMPERIAHVRWAEECDAYCVAPASADFIAKMALGVADDFPSTLYLAFDGPVIVAPAMEDQMWLHPAVQQNVSTLRDRGVSFVEPPSGPLASGRYGPGRLAEPPVIVDKVMESLVAAAAGKPLGGCRVLVSAGPTREHFDPVRVFTNPATGKMGYAVAEAARRLGADVVVVSGPTEVPAPAGVEVVRVIDADSMREEMVRRAPSSDIVVMAAAVSDFRPRQRAGEKLEKRQEEGLNLQMERTPDILAELVEIPGPRIVVGFAAETSDLEVRARAKLERKGCDLIVANLVGGESSGFAADANEVVILDRLGGCATAGPAPKLEVTASILDAVIGFRQRLGAERPGRAG